MTAPDAFFVPAGSGRWRATPMTQGPWREGEAHGGPPSALLVRELGRVAPEGGRLARISVDFLRPVPVAELEVRSRSVRPGRNVALLEAVLSAAGQDVLSARAWWMRAGGPGVPASPLERPQLPPAAGIPSWQPEGAGELARWLHRGFLSAMEWRWVSGSFDSPGPATVWARPRVPLVPGEQATGEELVMLLADCGNGASAALDFRTHLFVNVDLDVRLIRAPRPGWLSLDAVTAVDPDGLGLALDGLGDETGPVGRSAQSLVVRPQVGS